MPTFTQAEYDLLLAKNQELQKLALTLEVERDDMEDERDELQTQLDDLEAERDQLTMERNGHKVVSLARMEEILKLKAENESKCIKNEQLGNLFADLITENSKLEAENESKNRLVALLVEEEEDDVALCWTCDEKTATKKEWRCGLNQYEHTCDECHRNEYPEQYEDEEDEENMLKFQASLGELGIVAPNVIKLDDGSWKLAD